MLFCSRYLVKKKLQLGGIESMLDVGGQPQGSSQRETMLFGFVFSLVTNSPGGSGAFSYVFTEALLGVI